MKNLITYLLILLSVTGFVSAQHCDAQPSGVQPAFHAGERLTLKVSYRAKLIPNTEVATVVMSVADTTIDGRPYYCIYSFVRKGMALNLPSPVRIWAASAGLHTGRLSGDFPWMIGCRLTPLC